MSAAGRAWRRRAAFYCCLLVPLAPLIVLAVAHRLFIRRKGLVGLKQKLTGAGPHAEPGAILLHGVSLGEVQLMRPLLPQIETALGTTCIPCTTTETGHATACEHFPGKPVQFLPLDLPWAVNHFLQRLRPRALVLLELELWPMLLLACFQRDIPVIVVNLRLSAGSYRGYRRAGALLRPLFARIDLALAQNELWAARLRALGARRVEVSGSMKADMVRRADDAARDAEAQRIGLPLGPAHTKQVFLIASTSGDEEAALIRSWQSWGQPQGWRCVICPRHPERGAAIARACRERGISVVQTSTEDFTIDDSAVIIVDEIGRMGALYANAAIAVVGGSLGSGRGGQNMLEAAAAGCCTVVGPDTRNFPDAMALLRAAGGVVEVDDSSLDSVLSRLAKREDERQRIGAAGTRAWQSGQGATDRVITRLHAQLSSEK